MAASTSSSLDSTNAEDRALGDAGRLGDLLGRHRPPVLAQQAEGHVDDASRRSSGDIGRARSRRTVGVAHAGQPK